MSMSAPKEDIERAILYYQRMCLIGTDGLPVIREELCRIKQLIKDEEILLKKEYSRLYALRRELARLTKNRILKQEK